MMNLSSNNLLYHNNNSSHHQTKQQKKDPPTDEMMDFSSRADDDDDDDDLSFNIVANSSIAESYSVGDEEEGSVNVAHRDDIKLMNVVRAIVVLIILTMAFIGAETTFIVMTIAQEEDFRASYTQTAETLIAAFFKEIHDQLLVAKSLSDQFSSNNDNWPFVTVEDFQTRVSAPLELLSTTSAISVAPMVLARDRAAWEDYAINNYYKTTTQQSGDDNIPRATTTVGANYFPSHRTVEQGIYRFRNGTAVDEENNSILFPVWQTAPPLLQQQDDPHNNNETTTTSNDDDDRRRRRRTLESSKKTKQEGGRNLQQQQSKNSSSSFLHHRVLWNIQSNPDRERGVDDMILRDGASYSNWLYSDGNDLAWFSTPRSALYYPIRQNVVAINDGVVIGSTIVAGLELEFVWQNLLKIDTTLSLKQHKEELLPPVLAVLENSCDADDRKFSFQVTGFEAKFMGMGNLHNNPKEVDGYYGGHAINSTFDVFFDLLERHRKVTIDGENAATITSSSCNYRVIIYPTLAFRDFYINDAPEKYRWAVLGIFFIMVGIFLAYDLLVERRQTKVVSAAQRSDAIVRSLFPDTVRDRLYQNAAKEREKEKQRKAAAEQQKKRAQQGVTGVLLNAVAGAITTPAEAASDWQLAATKQQAGVGMIDTPKSRLRRFVTGYEQQQQQGQTGNASVINKDGLISTTTTTASGYNNNKLDPIADLFPNTTILFADIAGFTAWSSEREPSQVFTLLETIFRAMDKTAKRLGVFKVETVGDCYVAAAGVPDPQPGHAVIMARFSRTCILSFNTLTKRLESQLGPGTAELALRAGLHSGPVTAGVLRGQKARFQLFGDTMNMAARMESNGAKHKVHMSADTAKLLTQSKKQHWVVARPDLVDVKGKGQCQTYWLVLGNSSSASAASSAVDELESNSDNLSKSNPSDLLDQSSHHQVVDAAAYPMPRALRSNSLQGASAHNSATQRISKIFDGSKFLQDELGKIEIDDKLTRLIDWNTDVLMSLLRRVVATSNHLRGASLNASASSSFFAAAAPRHRVNPAMERTISKGTLKSGGGAVLEELQMVISLPAYNPQVAELDPYAAEAMELPPVVSKELHDYVAAIATGYRRNSFHNFEHASHVILSANKLLKRILFAEEINNNKDRGITTEALHKHTYGIGTDPITHFAIVFSALIHDVGHKGVPNGRLALEEPEIAAKYLHKSVAEQRSVDIAWQLLLQPHFSNLRACIYQDKAECSRFRALLVNSVLATDIFDKELKELRNKRWDLAFHPERKMQEQELGGSSQSLQLDSSDGCTDHRHHDNDRKATIVIEHVIQASDVAHTMQHWHVYLRWNERLFEEMYIAHLQGRSPKNPSEGWYEGELWFFDNYVIPLANKLKDCGVFGVSSDEYLTYAMQNRNEWERKGKSVVAEMIQNAKQLAERLGLARLAALTQQAAAQADDVEDWMGQEVLPDDDDDEPETTTTTRPKPRKPSFNSGRPMAAILEPIAEVTASFTREPNDITSSFSSNEQPEQAPPREVVTTPPAEEKCPLFEIQLHEVTAPPGPLGLILGSLDDESYAEDMTEEDRTWSSGNIVVHQVSPGSPLVKFVKDEDVIVAMDGINARKLTPEALAELVSVSAHNIRRLTVERRVLKKR